jgi:hypothetical protein
MKAPSTRFARLCTLLDGTVISGRNTTYHCCHINDLCIVFSSSEGTRKVMIPTDVVLEWIAAYEFGLIHFDMDARKMRDIIKSHSEWAPYQHGFETHLRAIVFAWATSS